jgi:hypothetical protein
MNTPSSTSATTFVDAPQQHSVFLQYARRLMSAVPSTRCDWRVVDTVFDVRCVRVRRQCHVNHCFVQVLLCDNPPPRASLVIETTRIADRTDDDNDDDVSLDDDERDTAARMTMQFVRGAHSVRWRHERALLALLRVRHLLTSFRRHVTRYARARSRQQRALTKRRSTSTDDARCDAHEECVDCVCTCTRVSRSCACTRTHTRAFRPDSILARCCC